MPRRQRDPQMHQTRKGKQWYFGMKVHTGTDADSGLVHTVKGTRGKCGRCERSGRTVAWGRRKPARRFGLSLQGTQGPGRGQWDRSSLSTSAAPSSRPLTQAQRLRNRRLSRVRAVVEHPFLVVKRLWGHAKVRYRGIAKNLAQMNTLFGLANLYRVRYRLLSP